MATVKLFRLQHNGMLPYALVDLLRSTGDRMHHSQGELWIAARLKKDALAVLANVTDTPDLLERPNTIRLAGEDVYSEALRAAGLPEPGEVLFCHNTNHVEPVRSLKAGEPMTVRGHFRPKANNAYGVDFVVTS